MVDAAAVCCMCGDVGFSDKLFRCINCNYRFQHLYCSNKYKESPDPIEICDWCESEEKISRHGGSSKKSTAGEEKGKNSAAGAPSPRTATRRYKLLKDVMS